MSSLKKNIAYQAVYELLLIALPLVTSPYIARVLGAEQLGIYSYTSSIAYYFQIAAMLGIKYHGTRQIAAVRDNPDELNSCFTSLFVVHVIMSVLMIISYSVYCMAFVKENATVAWIQGIFVIASLFDINWFFYGIEKFKITVTRNSIIKILTVVSIFCLVRDADDLWKYAN